VKKDEKADNEKTMVETTQQPVSGGLATWSTELPRILSNFEGDERQIGLLQMKAMTAGSGGDDSLSTPIDIESWMIHEVEFESEEGELVKTFRCVLIEPNGAAHAFVSGGVAKGLRNLIGIFGNTKLDPPVRVTVEAKRTQKGRRVYVLVPVTE
jgi:hypothetical protein